MAQQPKEVVEMEVDEEACQPKVKEKATEEKCGIDPEKLKIETFDIGSFTLSELVQLAEGYQADESEESVVMTREEINNYMKQKMREYSEDPEINKLINVKEQVKEKLDVLKNIEQKLLNERVGYVDMLDDQMKLLQHAGELPKAETRNASAYVDFPILPEELPPVELLRRGEYFVDDIPSCKILRPSAKASKKSDSAFKKSTNTEELELIPKVECIDISNDTPIKSTNDACIQPTRDAPAQSTSKATSRRRAKSSRIAPAMLTYTEPTASTSANSGATGGAPEMKGPSAPLVLRPSAPLVLRPSTTPLVLRPYTAHIITLPNLPPKPCLGICNGEGGIILKWNMPSNIPPHTYGRINSFEIFAYQAQNEVPFDTKMWQKLGSVNAMELPMACTLLHFKEGFKYYFIIRAVDIFQRFGVFSDPVSIIHNKTMV